MGNIIKIGVVFIIILLVITVSLLLISRPKTGEKVIIGGCEEVYDITSTHLVECRNAWGAGVCDNTHCVCTKGVQENMSSPSKVWSGVLWSWDAAGYVKICTKEI